MSVMAPESLQENALINQMVLAEVYKGQFQVEMDNGEFRKAFENAEIRWVWAKTNIEPHIRMASNDEDATGFLPNAEFLIRNYSKSCCIVKGRKQGHSWAIALKALARAVTEPRSTTIIGSYDEDEAKAKLSFLNWQYSVLDKATRDYLKMSDGSQARYFANGSKILFIARKAPTGAGAAIEWDEFSVEKQGAVSAGEILTAALGATTHTGTVSIGGTQRGPDTVFNKIVDGRMAKEIEENPFYEPFRHKMRRTWLIGKFPWWTCQALCKDVPTVLRLGEKVEQMDTRERVDKFGNDKLVDQFVNYCTTPDLGISIFQREFEMAVVNDKESYFPLALIEYCYPKGREANSYWFQHTEILGAKYGRYGDALSEAKSKIRMLAGAIRNGVITGEWGYAWDIGLDNDKDEIMIGRAPKEDRGQLQIHLSIGAHKLPFDGKLELLDYMLSNLPITRGLLDGTKGSVGRQMSTQMNRKYGQRVGIFEFTNSSKQIICANTKARMEDGKLTLPPFQPGFTKLQDQMLKVVKYTTPSGNVIFDVERNKEFHGDAFYALAMLNDLFYQKRIWRPRPPSAHNGRRNASQMPALG